MAYFSVSISTQNLKCLALTKNKDIIGVVSHPRLGFNTVYLHAKFDGSRTENVVKFEHVVFNDRI